MIEATRDVANILNIDLDILPLIPFPECTDHLSVKTVTAKPEDLERIGTIIISLSQLQC